MSLRARDSVAPGLPIRRIPCVLTFDAGKIERVVANERSNPGEAAYIDRQRADVADLVAGGNRSGGVRRHGVVLSQSRLKAVKATGHLIRL